MASGRAPRRGRLRFARLLGHQDYQIWYDAGTWVKIREHREIQHEKLVIAHHAQFWDRIQLSMVGVLTIVEPKQPFGKLLTL